MKTATRRSIAQAGGLEAASTITRIGKSQLARCYDQTLADSFVPVDVALDIDRAGPEPSITAALAAALGYSLLPVALGDGDVERALEAVAATAGTTITDAMRAIREEFVAVDCQRLLADLSRLSLAVQQAKGLLLGRMNPGVRAVVTL
jgi:hypothetical protein